MSSDWQRSLVILSGSFVTVTILAVLYIARPIFLPIVLAAFLAFVLAPLVNRLQRRGISRTPAVLLTVGMVVCITIGVGALVTQQVSKLADTLPDRKEAIKAKLVKAKEWINGDGNSRFGALIEDVTSVIAPKSPTQQTVVTEESFASQYGTYLNPAGEFLGQAMFAFVLTVFFLIKKEDLRNRIIRLIGDGKVTTMTKAVDDASTRISRFLLMQLLINSGFGVLITVSLYLLGVDYALLWGFIAAVMRYVPYIGTPLGMIPAVLFSFATAPEWGGGWGQPLTVIAMFVIYEVIGNNVFEPWLYGKSMGLSEVAQLIAAAFWAFLWGPVGLILSGPLTTCLLVVGKYFPRYRSLEVILGVEPPLKPEIAFYQRLAARDQDEAATVAMKVARKDGPTAALEQVIIPALCIARGEQDNGDLSVEDFHSAVLSAREIVGQLSELKEAKEPTPDQDRVRVLIVPVRDEAEHVAAEALAVTLDPNRWEVTVATDEMLASELVAEVERVDPAVVVIVALPPGGLSNCRYLVNRLRVRCPGVRLVIGRWSCGEEIDLDSSLGIKGADGIDKTLGETRKRLHDLLPVFSAANRPARKKDTDLVPIGTAGA